jgi:carbamoyl-phosphate synthase large subunit
MKTIGITGSGSLVGQSIIKSIKNSSFKNKVLIGMDYFKNTIGSYWVDEHYILPDILDNSIEENVWLKSVLSIIKTGHIEILFIGVDFELSLFSKYKLHIEAETSCIVVVSSEDTITIADDKYLTYKFLKDNNLFYPATFLENEIEKELEENKIKFPLIVKPRNGYRSIDVYLVKNREELLEKIKKVSNPIIQECIGSKDDEYTCGVINFNNDIKESIVLRRDLKDGNTSTTYLKNNYPPIIKEYIESVSKKLNQFGVCNFQLRVDTEGVPKIFEINARHSGTTYIRSLYGFNEIEFILEYLLNDKKITFSVKEGVVKRYFEEFFVKSVESK